MCEIKDITEKKTVIESLRLIQLEKILIIAKETDFIENILLYFKGYEKKEQGADKNFIYNNIERLEHDIKSIKNRIVNLTDINDEILEFSNNLKFLLFYDYIQTQIEEMLILLEGIYVKMNQLFGETLNQYLPYPTFFGRRFSSFGLMIYLDKYFEKLDSLLSKEHKKENNMVLGWSYNTGFKHKVLRNRDLLRINYNHETHNDYIELPYWYYELPLLIPAITHEVVRISLRSRDTDIYKSKYKEFEETILNFFNDKSNDLIQEINEVLGYEILTKDFIKDIFSDILSFEIHGKAYFYTLFHNLVAEGIAKDFLKIVYEDKEEGKKGRIIVRYEFRPNDWFFSLKRDHNHLRIYFLLYYWENKSSEEKDYKEIEEIKEILNTIMDLSGKGEATGFKKLFKENYPNYHTTYEVVENYLQQLYRYLQLNVKKIDLDISDKIYSQSKYFNLLWDERFESINKDYKKVPYKGRFRQIIHYNVSKIDYLKPENKLEIFVLTLRKLRKDKVNKKAADKELFFKEIRNEEKAEKKDNEQRWRAYGIYDIAILEYKKSYIDVKSEIQNMIRNNIENPVYYFDAKSILMKISQEIKGKNSTINSGFGIIINIELKKSSENCNGYYDFRNSVLDIEKKLKDAKKFFNKANIYKSLGPKDLTVIVENCSVENSYLIIEDINKIESLNRTSSIIISSPNKNLDINKKQCSICSYIRIPKKMGNNAFENIKKIIKNGAIYQTIGVMDYRIEWQEVGIEEIFENYKKLLPHITDYQTVIERKMKT